MGNLIKFKFPRAPHLLVAAESWPPHIKVNPEGVHPRISGPMAEFLQGLSLSLNFTYTIVQGDGYWGATIGNGSWNGMIGMVLRKEADIGLGPFGMSYIRSQVVDFSMPLFREVLHVLVSRPIPQPDPWGFISLLTWSVWIGILLSFSVVVVILTVVDHILDSGGSHKFDNNFWLTYKIFTSQNISATRDGLALRLVTLLWMLSMLIVIRSYSGTMTSMLAVKTVPIKYDSLSDVLVDPKVKILMEGSTALTAHLQTVKEGIYKDLADALKTRGIFVKASAMQEEAYRYLPQGQHAMLLEAVGSNNIYSDHFQKTGRCDFYKSREVFWPLHYALIVRQGSTLRNLVDSRILALREFGIIERWILDQTPQMIYCIKMPTKIKRQGPYSIYDLWAVFVVAGCGLLLSCIAFGFEMLITKPSC
ncbi:glutamate receptor ionotropic, kainate glr-3-like [Palaemon carinicauda]|uniref:glutamate receptor ionotropic, kainate glr-3-like n=1 Tax=Palaemon carinicauda TaxID=392227 RepID=UPI0035B588F6